jgi:hypothetical protein
MLAHHLTQALKFTNVPVGPKAVFSDSAIDVEVCIEQCCRRLQD